jgi:Protein of unknown function (DUF2911)
MRMRVVSGLLCTVVLGLVSISQTPSLLAQATPAPAPKAPLSPPAKAEVTLPSATISIDYSAPSVRRRKIFGALVPYGEVWRTGANAATTLKTSGNLMIGDLKVPAGTYTLYSLPGEDRSMLIVNKQTGQWGTVYDKSQDLGRTEWNVDSNAPHVETMVIDFEKTSGDSTELHVKWDGVDASVKITAPKVTDGPMQ